jgi:glucose-1-phosphate adenylyltransferase
MGIYVFEKHVLHKLLTEAPERTDFGNEILPQSAKDHNVQANLFKD